MLMETEDGRVTIAIRMHEVKSITFRDGIQAPYPILQVGFGLALSSVAYFAARHLIDWIEYGGTFYTGELWTIGFAALGSWLVFTAFRRGPFLDVETVHGRKRLLFQERPEPASLDDFVMLLEQRYNVQVG